MFLCGCWMCKCVQDISSWRYRPNWKELCRGDKSARWGCGHVMYTVWSSSVMNSIIEIYLYFVTCKKWGGWWRWATLVRMEWRPAGWSVCLPLLIFPYHKVQKFSSGTGSSGWSQKKGRKTVVVCSNHILHVMDINYMWLLFIAYHILYTLLFWHVGNYYIAVTQSI